MKLERSSGVILHPTSLPGPFGIGTMGAPAYRFVDWLASAEQRLWQICPLGPTGFGNSPYQCFSAFAGNPLLVDLESLVDSGWIASKDLRIDQPFDKSRTDYERQISWKWPLLAKACRGFRLSASNDQRAAFAAFCDQNAFWLDDFALYMSIKGEFGLTSWTCWNAPARDRDPATLERYRKQLSDRIVQQKFAQYLFFQQWDAIKQYANGKNVKIIGDIPIFVALDSADVWSRRDLFQLDSQGNPAAVAGVPPDYFSKTGQLWGNPLYAWERHSETDYGWWIEVIRSKLRMYDMLRVDHFRGFAAHWRVPFGETTAVNGTWVPSPGKELFETVKRVLGDLPIIAEDLGLITPDVVELRDYFGFPGMKILQFAFDSAEENEFRPHTYPFNSVAYTGTHDNDTVRGWHGAARPPDRAYASEYLHHAPGDDIVWDFLRACWASPSVLAIAPLQDILGLGSDARFNTPGTTGGNWEWRFEEDALTPELAQRLKRLSALYVRSADLLRKPVRQT